MKCMKWAALAVPLMLFACDKGSPTSPDLSSKQETTQAPAPVAVAPQPAADPTAPSQDPPPADPARPLSISADGTVVASGWTRGLFVCVYYYTDYQKQTRIFESAIPVSGNGSTPLPRFDLCGAHLLQVDVSSQAGGCPADPFGPPSGSMTHFLAGRAGIRYAGPTCQDSCENYKKPDPPVFVGALALANETDTQVDVTVGTISPVGVLAPPLPTTVPRPAFDKPDLSFEVKDTVTQHYGPEQLECSVVSEHTYSIEIPHQCIWIDQEATIEWGEFGECKKPVGPSGVNKLDGTLSVQPPPPVYTECDGVHTRYGEETVKQVNSCTQETRIKDGYPKRVEETLPCEYQCLAELCHTENSKWCAGDFCVNNLNDEPPLDAPPDNLAVSWVLKWKCQNVPPGTPGHYPNHFPPSNGHADFFGQCDVAHCYSITN